jgi:hypothetical protein
MWQKIQIKAVVVKKITHLGSKNGATKMDLGQNP